MPIYMDRHDVSEEVTAAHVAQLHSHDLHVQDQYKCKAITYWFDDTRKTAFCLVEAPNKAAMIAMHDAAHGKIPSEIIEVDASIVESFLGRIEDPEKAVNADLNIINDPAFRAIMVVKPIFQLINKNDFGRLKQFSEKIISALNEGIADGEGRMVRNEAYETLLSFGSVSGAVNCALRIKDNIEKEGSVSIGISVGVPVTTHNGFFEKTITEASCMSTLESKKINISKETGDLYQSENANLPIHADALHILQDSELIFLEKLINEMETNFMKDTLQSSDFHGGLGVSKSQFYRKITGLLNKTPNQFLKAFRLNKSLLLLHATEKSVSEIAFLVGFKSQSQYSKSFQKQFGISPTDFRLVVTAS